MKLTKTNIILIGIMLVGAFLRFHRLSELMPFIADQGWFYISARDMILTGHIPLVGIASSHTWLHQGALWTYVLALILKLFRFNPVIPAYFTALLGVFSIALIYKLGKEMFSQKVALISSFLFATSPLLIMDARMAYHTSPIPFFVILLILSTHRWIKGNVLYFPVAVFLLAMLYNLELATFPMAVALLILLSSGLIKKKKWAIKILSRKIIALSIVSFLVPMMPMILYDLNHGFPQTVKFVIWLFYKVAVFLGYPPVSPNVLGEAWSHFSGNTLNFVREIIFLPSSEISLVILLTSITFLGYKVWITLSNEETSASYALVLLFFLVPALAYIAVRTSSAAYTPLFYPQIILMVAMLIDHFMKNRMQGLVISLGLIIFGLSNSYLTVNQNYLTGPSFIKRLEAARAIIKEADGRPYNILGRGKGSQFESFIMPHEYLTWWMGHGPSDKNEKLRFYVSEHTDRIEVERK